MDIERQGMDVTQLLLCHGERKLPNEEDPVQVGISYLVQLDNLCHCSLVVFTHINKEI